MIIYYGILLCRFTKSCSISSIISVVNARRSQDSGVLQDTSRPPSMYQLAPACHWCDLPSGGPTLKDMNQEAVGV